MKRNTTTYIVDFFKKKSKQNESLASHIESSSSSISNFPFLSPSISVSCLPSPSPSTSASSLPSLSPSTSISVPVSASFEENDITAFLGKKLDIFQKVDALSNVYTPNQNFIFPKNPQLRNLKFQYSWLDKFKWLSYSKAKDAAFCKYCVIFGPESAGKGNQDLKQLVKESFRNWKKSLETFKYHQNLQYHQKSLLDSESASLIVKKKTRNGIHSN